MKKTILATLLLGSMVSFNVMAENADRIVDRANVNANNAMLGGMHSVSTMTVNGKEVSQTVDYKHELSMNITWVEKTAPQKDSSDVKAHELDNFYAQGFSGSVFAAKSAVVNSYLATTHVDEKKKITSDMGEIETGITYAFMPTLSKEKTNYAHLYYHVDFSTLDGIQNHFAPDSNGQAVSSQTPISHGVVLEGDKMVELGKSVVLEEKGNYQLVVTVKELNS